MEGKVQRDEERKRDKIEGEIKTWLERKNRERKEQEKESQKEKEK